MKVVQAVPGSEDYQARIDEIQDELRDYQTNPRLVQSPEELEELERAIRELTEELAALLSGRQIQHSLDSEQMHEAQSKLAARWPHRLRIHESEGVWIRTAGGYEIWVEARYFRRKGQRSGKRRYRGFYLGLLLLGINERCTSGFAAEVSLLAAMLGSLAEARAVLAQRGIRIDIKVLRRISEADRVLFVADGARWIWNRVGALVHELGLKPEQVYELIDFYHAVEHLGKVAGLRKSWTARQRRYWVRKHRRLLRQGQVEKVIDAVKEICRGRNSKCRRAQYAKRDIPAAT